MILIAQLKLTSKLTDLYNRENHSANSSAVFKFNEEWQNYEVKKLMSHWTRKLEYKKINEYLVHWKEWFSIHDIWYRENLLKNFKKLVEEYDRKHLNKSA